MILNEETSSECAEYTANDTARVELTVNATLPMLMLTVERAEP